MKYPPDELLPSSPTVKVDIYFSGESHSEPRYTVPLFPSKSHALPELIMPTFFSDFERQVFDFLFDRFEDSLAFPNIPLKKFITRKLSPSLDSKQLSFIQAPSHVDICVIDDSTLVPKFGIEVDGPDHDMYNQPEKDAIKNSIFRAANLPLIRICPVDFWMQSEIERHVGVVWAVAFAIQNSPHSTYFPNVRTKGVQLPPPDPNEIQF